MIFYKSLDIMNQIGGSSCSLCGAPGVTKLTCPLNNDAKKPIPAKHNAAPAPIVQSAPKAKVNVTIKPKPSAAKAKEEKVTLHLTPNAATPVAQAAAVLSSDLSLPDIYLKTDTRMQLKRSFDTNVLKNKDVKQCVAGDLDKYFTLQKRLGNGSFGIVHSAKAGNHVFAVKEGRASVDVVKSPWSKKTAWSEALILRDIANPLVERGVCPNLPLMYSAHSCAKCEFEGLNAGLGKLSKKAIKPCMILLMELAGGDLANWLEKKPSADEIYNALFQILAGLYALQKFGQVFNNDIKAPNILYYNVTPGGYWVYNIMGKRYHVPNMGKLFIINDFGVSSAYLPHLYSSSDGGFTMGRRTFIMVNKKIVGYSSEVKYPGLSGNTHSLDEKRNPIRTPYADVQLLKIFKLKLNIVATFKPEQLAVLKEHGIPADPNNLEFYGNSDIVPALQFSADVIDSLSMFVGGVYRATQTGKHAEYGIPDSVKTVLLNYIPKATKENIKLIDRTSSPGLANIYQKDLSQLHSSTANAGYMLDELFGNKKVVNYLTAPAGAPIESFTI